MAVPTTPLRVPPALGSSSLSSHPSDKAGTPQPPYFQGRLRRHLSLSQEPKLDLPDLPNQASDANVTAPAPARAARGRVQKCPPGYIHVFQPPQCLEAK